MDNKGRIGKSITPEYQVPTQKTPGKAGQLSHHLLATALAPLLAKEAIRIAVQAHVAVALLSSLVYPPAFMANVKLIKAGGKLTPSLTRMPSLDKIRKATRRPLHLEKSKMETVLDRAQQLRSAMEDKTLYFQEMNKAIDDELAKWKGSANEIRRAKEHPEEVILASTLKNTQPKLAEARKILAEEQTELETSLSEAQTKYRKTGDLKELDRFLKEAQKIEENIQSLVSIEQVEGLDSFLETVTDRVTESKTQTAALKSKTEALLEKQGTIIETAEKKLDKRLQKGSNRFVDFGTQAHLALTKLGQESVELRKELAKPHLTQSKAQALSKAAEALAASATWIETNSDLVSIWLETHEKDIEQQSAKLNKTLSKLPKNLVPQEQIAKVKKEPIVFELFDPNIMKTADRQIKARAESIGKIGEKIEQQRKKRLSLEASQEIVDNLSNLEEVCRENLEQMNRDDFNKLISTFPPEEQKQINEFLGLYNDYHAAIKTVKPAFDAIIKKAQKASNEEELTQALKSLTQLITRAASPEGKKLSEAEGALNQIFSLQQQLAIRQIGLQKIYSNHQKDFRELKKPDDKEVPFENAIMRPMQYAMRWAMPIKELQKNLESEAAKTLDGAIKALVDRAVEVNRAILPEA